jgi:hypothetical protein
MMHATTQMTAPASDAPRTPFAHLGHRRLLGLIRELEVQAAGPTNLPTFTAHLVADIVDFLHVERCRVVVPVGLGWRIAAHMGWGEDGHRGDWVAAADVATLDQTRGCERPRLALDTADVPGAPARRYTLTPVRRDGLLIAVIEMGPFDANVQLDDYSAGFLSALADVMGRAVETRRHRAPDASHER